MNIRTAANRALRTLRDGPRPLPGKTRRTLHISDDADLLASQPGDLGQQIAPGERVRVSAEHEPPLWVARAPDVTILPRLGIVASQQGAIYRSTAHEALEYDPRLTSFPYFRGHRDELQLQPPNRIPTFGRTAVWLPFHATYNYGHFILDGLTSLLALEEAALLGEAAAIAPPLKSWQKELLSIAFPGQEILTIRHHVVRAEEAAFASSMAVFLHAPTSIVGRLRERILANHHATSATHSKRIYLSRRGWSMRVMLNEEELEAELTKRGFAIVHPERLSITQQIDILRGAEVVVAPTGAALTNVLWAPLDSRLIEIRPVEFGDAWVPLFREVLGADWRRFHAPDPVPPNEVPLRYRRRLGFRFAYRVDLPRLLAMIDETIQAT